jgi:2-C-methyl-D-erythritol 2,4-cyclodiphosphate synthase
MKNQLLSTAYGHSRKSLEQSLGFSREKTLIRGIGDISVSWQKSRVNLIFAGFTMTCHNCLNVNDFWALLTCDQFQDYLSCRSGTGRIGTEGEETLIRAGQGSGIHALSTGRRLIIGGVEIPHELGLLGHSDADVLLHAIIDALLGAAGMGDIGQLFPDTDECYRSVDSRVLLRSVRDRLAAAGWRIVNVDVTINAERPTMAPHIPSMTARIADDLGVSADRGNMKAKPAERLGFVGREEGIRRKPWS